MDKGDKKISAMKELLGELNKSMSMFSEVKIMNATSRIDSEADSFIESVTKNAPKLSDKQRIFMLNLFKAGYVRALSIVGGCEDETK